VFRTVFEARYLVLGLGDVYLGAPVATPLDPRHRLVTTKYNPARTWTPENAVGIGGAYLCVYGMEGPGGYQFVGRTLQMWNRWRHGTPGSAFEKPWLLRFFDQIRFEPVGQDELLAIRERFPHGGYALRVEEGEFSLREYRRFLAEHAESISAFKATQQAAFEAERERWAASGQDCRARDRDRPARRRPRPGHQRAGQCVAGERERRPARAGRRGAGGDRVHEDGVQPRRPRQRHRAPAHVRAGLARVGRPERAGADRRNRLRTSHEHP